MSGNATVYPVEVRGKRCRGLAEAKASTTPDPYPRGRSLHVTRAFQPGDEILCLAEPVLAVPRGPVPACAWCLSMDDEKTLLACSGCKGAAAYCGKDCQRQHWRRGHKTECKVLRRVRDEKGSGATLPSLVRMLIQALGDPRVREAIQVLEGNMEAIREKKSEWQDLWFQAEAAVYYSGKGTNEEAFELACKIRCNCHSKLDRMAMSLQADDVAVFLDTTFAMINHSCVPNAEWFTLGRTTHVVATAPLLEGDEITIQYRGVWRPAGTRQALPLDKTNKVHGRLTTRHSRANRRAPCRPRGFLLLHVYLRAVHGTPPLLHGPCVGGHISTERRARVQQDVFRGAVPCRRTGANPAASAPG